MRTHQSNRRSECVRRLSRRQPIAFGGGGAIRTAVAKEVGFEAPAVFTPSARPATVESGATRDHGGSWSSQSDVSTPCVRERFDGDLLSVIQTSHGQN